MKPAIAIGTDSEIQTVFRANSPSTTISRMVSPPRFRTNRISLIAMPASSAAPPKMKVRRRAGARRCSGWTGTCRLSSATATARFCWGIVPGSSGGRNPAELGAGASLGGTEAGLRELSIGTPTSRRFADR